jgi:hypothetical protein
MDDAGAPERSIEDLVMEATLAEREKSVQGVTAVNTTSAVRRESAVENERAGVRESAEAYERAMDGESTVGAERAVQPESTGSPERAVDSESAENNERAVAQASTDASERTAAKAESTDDQERPPWPLLPESTTVHPSVDLGADDPAANGFEDSHRRRCVGTRRDGHRCNGWATDDSLGCPFHNGRSDPRQAALASHEARKAATEQAASVLALQKLGVRATVAHVLTEKATEIRSAVALLADAAAGGDLKSAQALLPWIDQALGRPTERHEVTTPTSLDDLESMDTSALERLVAEGRARRLRAVQPSESDSA